MDVYINYEKQKIYGVSSCLSEKKDIRKSVKNTTKYGVAFA